MGLYLDFVTEIKEGIGNKYLDLPAREVECSIELSHVSNQFGKYGEMNKDWTASDAKGFIKITANAHKIFKSINKNI